MPDLTHFRLSEQAGTPARHRVKPLQSQPDPRGLNGEVLFICSSIIVNFNFASINWVTD